MRYILTAAEKTLPTGAGYEFVDASGNVVTDTNMSTDVDVTHLTQYLFIDNPDANIPKQTTTSINHMS